MVVTPSLQDRVIYKAIIVIIAIKAKPKGSRGSWKIQDSHGGFMQGNSSQLGSWRVREGHGCAINSKEVSMKLWLGSWKVGRLRIRLWFCEGLTESMKVHEGHGGSMMIIESQ